MAAGAKTDQKDRNIRTRASGPIRLLVLLITLGLAVGFGLLLSRLAPEGKAPEVSEPAFSDEAQETFAYETAGGAIEGRLPDGDVELLGDPTGEHFFYQINLTPTFPTGSGEGSIAFENPPGNLYLMRVSFLVDDQTVYRSGLVSPGYYMAGDKLSTALEAGGYAGIALIEAVDPDTLEVADTYQENLYIQVG